MSSLRGSDDADRSEVPELIRMLLRLVEARRPLLTSRLDDPTLVPRQLGATALTRSAALLDGGRALVEAGRADLYGIVTRSIWECWVLGHYILLEREQAVTQDLGYFKKRWRLMGGAALPGGEEIDETERNLKSIADRVDELLALHGRPWEVGTYDSLYRHESTLNAHAGYGVFARYLRRNDGGGRWEIDRVAEADMPIRNREALTAMYVAHLADHVYTHFGIDCRALGPAFSALGEHANTPWPGSVRPPDPSSGPW